MALMVAIYLLFPSCCYARHSVSDSETDIRIDSLTAAATSISLSWNVSNGTEEDIYEVMWKRNISVDCSDEDYGHTNITDGSTSYDIMGLEEDSSYTITVTASNSAGSSAVVTAMTLEAGER